MLFIATSHPIQNLVSHQYCPHIKLAQVTLVYKSGNEVDINNCRPISVIPCLFKLFEEKKLLANS
jgi:ribosomal protein S17